MTKEIKKCYHYMDLPYDSTPEQIEERQKIMIKIVKGNAIKNPKYDEAEIEKINQAAEILLHNIKINGIPKETDNSFSTSKENIFGLSLLLIFAVMITIVSFVALFY